MNGVASLSLVTAAFFLLALMRVSFCEADRRWSLRERATRAARTVVVVACAMDEIARGEVDVPSNVLLHSIFRYLDVYIYVARYKRSRGPYA